MSSNFVPLSSQLGVSGTSYRIQLGKIDAAWAARILKGNDVVASTSFPELNGNLVVGFVMRETAIPNLNPYQIMKTVQFLTREAQTNEQRMKEQGTGIPVPVQAPVPAEAPVERPAPADPDTASDEDTRASYRVVARPQGDAAPAAAVPATPSPAPAQGQPATISTGRKLKAIPSGDAAPAPAAAATPAQAAPAPAPQAKVQDTPRKDAAPAPVAVAGLEDTLAKILASLSRLEEKLARIEEELFR